MVEVVEVEGVSLENEEILPFEIATCSCEYPCDIHGVRKKKVVIVPKERVRKPREPRDPAKSRRIRTAADPAKMALEKRQRQQKRRWIAAKRRRMIVENEEGSKVIRESIDILTTLEDEEEVEEKLVEVLKGMGEDGLKTRSDTTVFHEFRND